MCILNYLCCCEFVCGDFNEFFGWGGGLVVVGVEFFVMEVCGRFEGGVG